MALKDELGKGKQAIDDAIKALNDLGNQAQQDFTSIAGAIQGITKNVQGLVKANGSNKAEIQDAVDALKQQEKSVKNLTGSANELSKFNSSDLKSAKETQKFLKQREKLTKDLTKISSELRKNEILIDQARASGDAKLESALLRQKTKLVDAEIKGREVLAGISEIADVNEKISKETGWADRLAESIKSIPGLGPLLVKPIQDASKAYRSMRLKEGSTKMQAIAEGAKGLADSFGPAFLLGSLFAADKRTTSLAKNLQISKEQATDVKLQFSLISIESGKAFVNQKNLVEATGQLVESLGVARGFTNDIVQSQNFLTKQMGLSADEAAQFNSLMILTSEDANQAKIDIADQVKLLEKETGIQLKLNKVVAAVAKAHAGLKAAYGFENKEIARQVVLTQKLGLEVSQTAKMANQLLDFESSIAKELEAELLTGRDLNLEQARLLALQGKSTEAAAELARQVGGTAELSKMNVIQQEALAEAMGMERNELIQSVQKREVLARLGVKNIEQLKEQGRLNELNGSALGEQLLKQYEQESAAAKFEAAVVKIQETLGTLMEGPLGSLVNGLADLVNSAGMLKGLLIGIVGISFARTIASFATMIVQMFALSGAAAATTSFITLGIGAIAAVAALTMMMGALDSAADQSKSKAQQMSANDFTFANGNLTEETKGGIQVNTAPEDVMIVGGSKLFGNNNNSNNDNTEIVMVLKEQVKELKELKSKDTNFVVNASPGADTFNFITEQQNVNEFKV
jgi:hypothetical protein